MSNQHSHLTSPTLISLKFGIVKEYKRTVCEPLQFGSNREHIAADLALYMRNAAGAAALQQQQVSSRSQRCSSRGYYLRPSPSIESCN